MTKKERYNNFKSDINDEYCKVINLICKKLNNNIANRFSYSDVDCYYERVHIGVIDESYPSLYAKVLVYKMWIYISFDNKVITSLIFKISKNHELFHSDEYNDMSKHVIRELHFHNKATMKCELRKK